VSADKSEKELFNKLEAIAEHFKAVKATVEGQKSRATPEGLGSIIFEVESILFGELDLLRDIIAQTASLALRNRERPPDEALTKRISEVEALKDYVPILESLRSAIEETGARDKRGEKAYG